MRILPRCFAAAALCASAAAPAAAQAGAGTVRGTVRLADGRPVPDATVLLLETLDETRSDSAGRFTLVTAHRGVATLAARRVGFHPAAQDVALPADSVVALVLTPRPPVLSTVSVAAAGEYVLGEGTTATLTPLEIAETPGAAANVAHAIQTLPGVQNVDEGTGLFVRGGDVTETRVLIDDATFLSPVRFDNPTGHVTSTVNPFLLSRTVFSAGGFGAPYGNALSGLVRMETAGRPTRSQAELTASIGTLGARGAWAPHRRLGFRGGAGLNDLSALFATFGEAQPFDPPPRGGDVSAAVEWQSSAAGRVRLFTLAQGTVFGVGGATATGDAAYRGETGQTITVLSWRDSSRAVRPALTLGRSTFDRAETTGGFVLDTELDDRHLVASLAWMSPRGLSLRAGGEVERLETRYRGRLTRAPDRHLFDATPVLDRRAAWSEAGWEGTAGLRLTAGLRTDDATLGAGRRWDPRLAAAWQRGSLGVTAAWGRYTQFAEPTFFRPTTPADRFTPMRVDQLVVGVQWGSDSTGGRLEVYDKRYADLWQFTRTFDPVGGGIGSARGADLLVRWQVSPATRTRLTWSTVQADRTDPNTGRLAPAPQAVRHSIVWVTQTTIRTLTIGTAVRWATGRPFTDVVGTVPGPAGPEPVWGDPNAERLPDYLRSDLSLSWYRGLGARAGMVLWMSASNLLDRTNVMRYRWSPDFTERTPVRAPFNRSLFAGATLLLAR